MLSEVLALRGESSLVSCWLCYTTLNTQCTGIGDKDRT